MVKVEGSIKSAHSAYNQTVNHDGQYPLDTGSPIEGLKREFEKGTESERSKLIETFTAALPEIKRQEEAFLSMSSDEIQKERW